ncbi:cAMP-responsive element modulator isoform X1 [Chanos chanos]|uniref:cAMP-responsive element modulator isoform X1 n=1 Tax=Chanos chanos TaxID=29144 RepID=A0A6J2VA97_CHACN|nr:cAMP-responsive element modulator-like isoform X1 [Chanos chanos]
METVVATQPDGGVCDGLTDGEAGQIQGNSDAPITALTQASVSSDGMSESAGVAVVTLPGGQTVQVHGVIQAPQPSVIQPTQVAVAAETVTGEETDASDTQKRREILSRRPSYRKILNELSSDTPAVPKIEEEEKVEEEAPPSSTVSTVTGSSHIYQTATGQYIAITQGGAIQIAGPGGDTVQGVQTLTLPSPATPQPGAAILQYAPQSGDSTQQLLLPTGQVLVQAATGDMPAYQIRSPSSGLPQGVVMAASPGAIHGSQQHAEEATRKREVRLMKNREAARECRRKKKEYVKCLENRVAVLENQNKTLIEELKALKDIYCHKQE